MRILPIALLRAEAPSSDDDHPRRRHPPPGGEAQSRADPFVKMGRACRIEAELNCARHFIDVLSAGAAGANEYLLDLVLGDGDVSRDGDHLREPVSP